MIMETISCGYPIVPSGLGVSPISPPSTPTGTDTYAPQLYAQTEYVQPGFASSPHSYSKYDEDANNNNHIYSSDALNNNNHNSPATSRSVSSSSDHDSLLSDFSCMSIAESDERFSDPSFIPGSPDYLGQMSPPSHPAAGRTKPKKSSRSKAKVSSSSSVSSPDDSSDKRKDSFVYDVRLPDEQILLFVPDLDLVKSHLMFAVREEVDVLKERIVDLMDRIKHLECENTILRQYASPEVLQQIQSQLPHQMQQPSHHSSNS